MMRSYSERQHVALAVLLGLSFLAAAWVAAPLYVGLVLGTVMAFSAQPLFGRFVRRLHRRAVAAALTTGVGGTVILAGGAALAVVLFRQLTTVVGLAQQKLAGATLQSWAGDRGARFLHTLHLDAPQIVAHAQEQLGDLSGQAATAARILVSATASAVLTAIIALFAMYYVTLEWPRLAARIERVLPLDPKHTRALFAEFRDVARSAFVGTVATGIVQGILAGIGFVVAGAPQALAWGVLTIVASVVPVFGTALVWAPVAVFLLLQGRPGAAGFVVAWGLLVVMALSDCVIRPRLAGGGARQGHPLLTLLGLLGGLAIFGLAGLVVGPVIMSLFVAIFRICERERLAGASGPGSFEPARQRAAVDEQNATGPV